MREFQTKTFMGLQTFLGQKEITSKLFVCNIIFFIVWYTRNTSLVADVKSGQKFFICITYSLSGCLFI